MKLKFIESMNVLVDRNRYVTPTWPHMESFIREESDLDIVSYGPAECELTGERIRVTLGAEYRRPTKVKDDTELNYLRELMKGQIAREVYGEIQSRLLYTLPHLTQLKLLARPGAGAEDVEKIEKIINECFCLMDGKDV